MRAAISSGADFDAGCGRLARQNKRAAQARRLLALALIYRGSSRADAALRSRNGSIPPHAATVQNTATQNRWSELKTS